ncbi:MAG: metallophosphoesterase [Deltaproteobacteria bacterium]|nr:metallophosphoesterase [Deltaproteobacteria bacterium]
MFDSVTHPTTQYLILSDIHLGSDLVQHARPWTSERLTRVLQIDYDLSSMLDHYRNHSEPGCSWTLIIAGDLVDFAGMSIVAAKDVELRTPLSPEEIEHGLGSAADHAVYKIRAVARRHALVFRKLAQFISAGHRLVLVRGNHDVDFYWEPVRRAFIDELLAHTDIDDDREARKRFESLVEFPQWFYYVKEQLYVEHGHQYDETCAHQTGLVPLSPLDPRRLAYSFSDILLRFIVRPTRGFTTEGHEKKTVVHYFRIAFSLGFIGCMRLFYRFLRAVVQMFRSWRAQLSERAQKIRTEQERTMQQIAQRFHISIDKLRRMVSLWAKPVTARVSSILRSVFLDVILSSLGLGLLLVLLLAFRLGPLWLIPILAAVGVFAITLWIRRSRVFDPKDAIKESARRVSQLLPARFVVMGHTHQATMESIGEGVTYINLGNWSNDILDDAAPKAPCSHLIIRRVKGELKAEFVSLWPRRPQKNEIVSPTNG